MIRVGITGKSGFIGTHLSNYLGLKDDIEQIPYNKSYFQNTDKLREFVNNADTIVHLAALNRHSEPESIYETNIELVEKLIKACEETDSTPHIIFSSSTKEELEENPYGKSKREGRKIFESWVKRTGGRFTGLIIPNVYGPFGQPFYNSVVSTFCYQLTHNEKPEIHVDNEQDLIYVNELVEVIYKIITNNFKDIKDKANPVVYRVPHSDTLKVSEILNILREFEDSYMKRGVFPDISNSAKLNLFNTFRCYIPDEFYPVQYQKHADERGSFFEAVRANSSGQTSFSITKPGVTRGDHFHTRKAERFAVVKGKALIIIRRVGSDNTVEYELHGDNQSFVDMPVWHTHNITNIGEKDLYTLFWINEFYDPEDPDTFYEPVDR